MSMRVPISVVIFTAMILVLLFPLGTSLKDMVNPLATILIYLNILELEFAPRKFFRRELLFWAVINIVVMPVVAFVIGSSLPGYLLLGLVMAALAPTAMNSPLFVGLVDGNREIGVSVSAIANISSMFYIPAMVFLMFGLSLKIPYDQMILNMISLIALPLVAVLVTRRLLKSKFQNFVSSSKNIIPFVMFMIIWIIFSMSADRILTSFDKVLEVMPLTLLLVSLGFGLGYIAGQGQKLKRTLAISCGYKNESLIVILAYSIGPLAIIPSAVYMVFHHIFNATVIWLFEKKKI